MRAPEARARDLLARMSLDEKLAQLSAVWLGPGPPGAEPTAPAELPEAWREKLRHGIGQISRHYGSRPVEPRAGARSLNALQRHLVEATRLGIPAIVHEESLTGFMAQGATQFPSPLGYGSTWDPDLIREVGAAIGRQLRAAGAHQALAPVCDVVRDARWGRVEECVGEDPYLVGVITSAYVAGLQGEDLRRGVAATLKHFCGYSGSEGGRNFAPLHAGPRELADVFLVPFEMAVKSAGARSVMNAYQEIDGIPCAANRALLTGTLRERWGFPGIVVADYYAVRMLHELHRTATTPTEAAAAALGAGLDVELPHGECFPGGLAEALARGLVSAEAVDVAVARVLRLKFELGIFECPYVDAEALVLERPEDCALARRVAERSLTLLANDGTLPISADPGRVAVIGPNADDPRALYGNYSFWNHVAANFMDAPPDPAPTVLAALRARLGPGRVVHAPGCRILRPRDPGESEARLCDDASGIPAAAAAARDADVAIVVVGDRAGFFRRGTVGEGSDTDDLALPGLQDMLLDAVLATGTPTVVVLLNGRPFELVGLAERAAAVLEAWFPGQEGAGAIAAVLVGDASPGGKTPVGFGQGAGAQPVHYGHKFLARGNPLHPSFRPVFPFGHGLGYTRFEYADLTLAASEVPTDGTIELAFALHNSGERPGEEVVQLYARDVAASVTRPVRELKGFRRVPLAPGAAARITFRLPADLLSFTGPELRRVVEPGAIDLLIGASSEDIRLRARVDLVGPRREVPETRALTSEARVEAL